MKAEDRYDSLFRYYASEHDHDWLMLKAQVKAESAFNAKAWNRRSGARGLAQFISGSPPIQKVAYAAGFIDGEGTIGIYRHKNDECNGGFYYFPSITVSQVERAPLEMIKTFLGVGSIEVRNKPDGSENQRACHALRITGKNAISVAQLIFPYLIVKKRAAEMLINNADLFPGRKAPRHDGRFAKRSDDEIKRLTELVQKTHELNAVGIDKEEIAVWDEGEDEKPINYFRTWEEWGSGEPEDPEQAIRAQSRYMKWLMDRLNGEVEWALAAYNWGIGNVQKLRSEKRGSFSMLISELPRETADYVDRILTYHAEYEEDE